MDEQRERDEFKRMQFTAQLQRYRELVVQYEVGIGFHRRQMEDLRYQLGRLDERLGGKA